MSYSQVYNRKIFRNINNRGEEEIIYLLKEGCNNDTCYDWDSITSNEWYKCKSYRGDFVTREHIEKGLKELLDKFSGSEYDYDGFDLQVGSKGYTYKKFAKYLNNYKKYEDELSNNTIEYCYRDYYAGRLFKYVIGKENYIEIDETNTKLGKQVFERIMERLTWYVDRNNFNVEYKTFMNREYIQIHFDIRYASYVQEKLGGYIVRVNNNYTGTR